MDEWTLRFAALLWVIVANTSPWAAGRLFGACGATPLDLGVRLRDGARLLGAHKTWRGLVAGALGCAITARLCGYPYALGAAFGVLSLAADAATSFAKRRMRTAPGAELPLLDQLPEALLPLIVLSRLLGIGLIDCLGIAAA